MADATPFHVARSCARAPTTSCRSEVGVSAPLNASTVGASIGFATGLSLHPAATAVATARAIVLYRFIVLIALVLESGGDSEVEGATRRIRCDVLESSERLIAEVRNLGIETRILRPSLQVSSAQLETGSLSVSLEQPAGHARRQIISKSQLAELHETGVLDVRRGSSDELLVDLSRARRVCHQTEVDQIFVGQIDAESTLSPVEQR